jgi:hypothetical protein
MHKKYIPIQVYYKREYAQKVCSHTGILQTRICTKSMFPYRYSINKNMLKKYVPIQVYYKPEYAKKYVPIQVYYKPEYAQKICPYTGIYIHHPLRYYSV